MIVVGSHQVNSLEGFSKDFFTFLEWIKDGYEWLNWATTKAKSVVCTANGEEELIYMIYKGLHASEIINFDNFQMSINKALSIDVSDLSILQESMNIAGGVSTEVEAVQVKWNLLSDQQLNSNSAFLSENEISGHPIFKMLRLHDNLSLYRFQVQFSKKKKVNQEALVFALAKATTIDEFCDFYKFYVVVISKQAESITPQQKDQTCTELYAKYNELCNYLIQAPNAGIGNTDKELKEGLMQFVKSQKFIGFKTKAAAMANLINNVALNDDYTINEDAIEAYMGSVCSKITAIDTVPDCQLSQDGKERIFTLKSNKSLISLEIDIEGDMYLLPSSIIKG